MLLLVTESNHAEMVYRADRPPHQFAVLKASLQSTSICPAGEAASEAPPVGPGGTRICTKAAIGLGSDCEDINSGSDVVAHVKPFHPQPNPSLSLPYQGSYLMPALVLAVSISLP